MDIDKKERDMAQQNIYDNNDFFNNFMEIREDNLNFNDIIETPIILSMMPDLKGKRILDLGCGMGQHAKQYVRMGASYVLGIDISEKMLSFARENNSAENIEYRRLPFERIEEINKKFDVVTSSLAFDYVEDFYMLIKRIHNLLNEGGTLVFSMSHPLSTAYDGTYDRYTRLENGERIYANLRNYNKEGIRKIKWVVDDYELYHRKISTLINSMVKSGFNIEECQESKVPEDISKKYPERFGGVMHQPDFIFFRCKKQSSKRFREV